MADSDLEKKRTFHDEGPDGSEARQVRLDQHGFPLRPQPSDDPKGECLYTRDVQMLMRDRSAELEQMAEVMRAPTSFFSGLSWPLHTSSHCMDRPLADVQRILTGSELRLLTAGKVIAYQHCRGLVPDNYLHCLSRCGAFAMVANFERLRSSTDICLRYCYRSRFSLRSSSSSDMGRHSRGKSIRRRWYIGRYGHWCSGSC